MATALTLHTLETDVENFFKRGESHLANWANDFVKVFKKAPAAIQTVENFVEMTAPVVEGAVALADPVAEPAAAAALSTIEVALVGLQTAATDATSGQTFLQNLQNFATDVPATLTTIDVKNPELKTRITGLANFITNETKILLPAVESWIKQLAPAAV